MDAAQDPASFGYPPRLGTPTVSGRRRNSRLAVTAGGVGNLIELYDATISAVLAPVFSAQFFPAANPATALFYTYGIVIGAAFVVRPLAGILLSPYGDRVGRRRLLSLTLLVMGAGLLMTAVTPPYRAVGWLAPVLFVVSRMVQNVSNAGEYQASSTFVVEHAPPDRRATAGSVQYVSSGIGILAATLVATVLTTVVPDRALGSWGWRLAFVLGALFCGYGLTLRLRVPESPVFERVVERGARDATPLRTVFRRHRRALLLAAVVQVGQVTYFTWQVFLPTYAHLVSDLPLKVALARTSIALVIFVALVPLVGAVSDRWTGRRPLVIAGAAGFAVLTYPMFRVLQHPTPASYLAVSVTGMVLLALTYGAIAALMCELFPAEVRTSGVGVAYNTVVTVFGGSVSLIATSSIAHHHAMFLAYWIVLLETVAAVVFVVALPETRGRRIEATA